MSDTGVRQLSSLLIYVGARAGALLVAALLIGLAWYTVPLTPHVDPSFFFGDEDPQLQEDKKLYKLFPRQDQIIINIEGKISSADYLNKVDRLTRRLLAIPEVVSARFRPVIAGIPYIIELIRRNLVHDLKVFSLSAVVVFGLMIFFLFRSLSILVGCLTAGAVATALTLLLNQLFEIEIGILTANLITIVFVLTLPHMIYLTYNWKRSSLDDSKRQGSVKQAVWETFPGSIWSTGTTLLGFLSLLLLQAKPLRQLGASGAIATLCAISAAYLLYPWFLVGSKSRRESVGPDAQQSNGR